MLSILKLSKNFNECINILINQTLAKKNQETHMRKLPINVIIKVLGEN